MKCPKCDNKTEVIDSRLSKHNRVRRRRKCKKCGHRFTTLEINIEDIEKGEQE